MLLDFDQFTRGVYGADLAARRNEVDPAHGLVVLAHVVVTLGAAGMVVESDTRADDVDESGATMADRAFNQRHQLLLVAGKTARHEGCAQLERHRYQVNRAVAVDHTLLALGTLVGGGRKLPFGQAVDTVVLHDIDHVDGAPHAVRELPQAYRGRIAIA